MKIIYADDSLSLHNTVVALGNFDGVHVAHQKLIEKAVYFAKENNLSSVVYTFVEHPQKIFGKSINIITTNEEKEQIFASLGVDILVYQRAYSDFFDTTPKEFVENIIFAKLGAKKVVVGEHYTFGAKASGNTDLLKKLANDFNVDINVESLYTQNEDVVSSSLIRDYILNGKMAEANRMLGREFSISGKVIHGNRIGSQIGFPTANILLDDGKITPKFGVYACRVIYNKTEYNAIANIGIKPTVGADAPLAEVCIFDFKDNLYDQNLTINLCSFIREEEKFSSVNELKKQIDIDVKIAMEYFSK